jgi:uncharacterized alpha-E superfamily protein
MLGRRLERIQFLAGLLSARLTNDEPLGQGELEWLLDVGGVSITYRTRYVATPQLAPVLQLLILEEASPRSLAFQWRVLCETLVALARSLHAQPPEQLEDPMARLAAIGAAGVEDEGKPGADRRALIAAGLTALVAAAGRHADRLALRHFSLVDVDLHAVAS